MTTLYPQTVEQTIVFYRLPSQATGNDGLPHGFDSVEKAPPRPVRMLAARTRDRPFFMELRAVAALRRLSCRPHRSRLRYHALFFMKFRGRNAHSNRPQTAMACPIAPLMKIRFLPMNKV
jgi:hypothetical protein